MNIKRKVIKVMPVCTTLAISLVFGWLCIKAKAEPLQVQISPVSHTTVMQGEPIVLHYVLVNNSAQYVTVNMGLDGAMGGTEWISRSLKSSTGENVTAQPDIGHSDGGGLHFNTLPIEPNSQKEGNLVVSQWFSITHPGHYILSIQVRLAYGLGANTGKSAEDVFASPTAYAQNYVFPLIVTPQNPRRLQALALSLEQVAIQTKDTHYRNTLVQELVSMPEAAAGPSWTALEQYPNLQGVLAKQLGHVPSIRAADILAQIVWPSDPTSDKGGSSQAEKELSEMYNHSNGALKAHIRYLYAQQGINLPEQILTLQNG